MAREIKFRVWNGPDGLFDYFDLDNCLPPRGRPTNQFTGFKDNNGKDVYEGDIIKPTPNAQIILRNVEFFVVKWTEWQSGWWAEGSKSGCALGGQIFGDFVLAGNIYENPDLLPD